MGVGPAGAGVEVGDVEGEEEHVGGVPELLVDERDGGRAGLAALGSLVELGD